MLLAATRHRRTRGKGRIDENTRRISNPVTSSPMIIRRISDVPSKIMKGIAGEVGLPLAGQGDLTQDRQRAVVVGLIVPGEHGGRIREPASIIVLAPALR